jgi:hypothetical protein
MAHKFKVGSTVRLKPWPTDPTRTKMYEVVRLLPPGVDGVPAYRIKDASGKNAPPARPNSTGLFDRGCLRAR